MQQDCQSSLRPSACTLGNVGGIISTALWFVVLFPQLIRNQQRRSVRGLNPLWALANFTASLCNSIFMFRIEVPVQTRVMAIYMPVLEFLMLLQFFFWYRGDESGNENANVNVSDETSSNNNDSDETTRKRWIAAICLVIWSSIVVVQAFSYSSSGDFAWAAIALWSVETFPQLYTNIKDPDAAVQGQSVVSILITCCGKSTDSLSAFLLKMPTQTRVLAYYSGSSAWINALYVLVIYVKRSNNNSTTNTKQQRDEQESEATKLIEATSGSTATNVANCANKLEVLIRDAFATSLGLRIGFTLLLTLLIAAVTTGCVHSIEPAWVVAFLPLSTAAVLALFHMVLARDGNGSRCDDKKR